MKLRAAIIMLIPALLFYTFSFVGPIGMVVRLSLLKTDYINTEFVGIQNFVAAVTDPYFQKSFVNAFIFVLFILPPTVIIATLISLLLMDFHPRFQSVARFMVYIPSLTSGYIIALLWKWILQRDGLINYGLSLFGIEEIPWLFLPWASRVAISLIDIVSSIGGNVILLSAAVAAIPIDLQDAAQIDGCTNVQYKRHVVLPLLMPMILLITLLMIVGIMKIWSTLYILTPDGGPEGATASPVYELFLTAFRNSKHGLGAAKGIILLFVIGGIIFFQHRVQKWVRGESH